MSLLLEALKKAERAKEEAQRRARGEGVEPQAPVSPNATQHQAVVTRDKLPDLATTPLEIVSDDISSVPATETPPSAPPPTAGEPMPPKLAPRGAAPRGVDDDAANRASARKVFEAKFREPNPRMPFYITMGVLGVFALGTVIYFWYQLRPPPALVNTNPPHQAEAAVVAEAKPITAPAPAIQAAPPASSAIPGLPSTTPPGSPTPAAAVPSSPPPAAVRKPAAEAQVETPRLAPRFAPARAAPASAPLREPAAPSAPPQVQPSVAAGYAAYIAGDLAAARTAYAQALLDEPANRDALLGLAAIDVRAGRYESAEGFYLRVLQADPRDAQAQAALIALRAGRSDPLATESRVKSLLAVEPGAHVLNFTLGNQLAQQSRWAEAQQEYFKAYIAEPENADFAYNLAVSLDHLRKPREALDYYQRAIGLAEKHGAGFDVAAARARVSQLAR